MLPGARSTRIRRARALPFVQFLLEGIQASQNVGAQLNGAMILFCPVLHKGAQVNLDMVMRHLVAITDQENMTIESIWPPKFLGFFSNKTNTFKTQYTQLSDKDMNKRSGISAQLVPFNYEVIPNEIMDLDLGPKVVKKFPILNKITKLYIITINESLPTQEYVLTNAIKNTNKYNVTSQQSNGGNSSNVSALDNSSNQKAQIRKLIQESDYEHTTNETDSTFSGLENVNRTLIPGPLQLIINNDQNSLFGRQAENMLKYNNSYSFIAGDDIKEPEYNNDTSKILENCKKLRIHYLSFIKKSQDNVNKIRYKENSKKIDECLQFSEYVKKACSQLEPSKNPLSIKKMYEEYLKTTLWPCIDNLYKDFITLQVCDQQLLLSTKKDLERTTKINNIQQTLSVPIYDSIEGKFNDILKKNENIINGDISTNTDYLIVPSRTFMVPNFVKKWTNIEPTINDNGGLMKQYGPAGLFAVQFDRQVVLRSGSDCTSEYLKIILTSQITHRRKEYQQFLNVCNSNTALGGGYPSLDGMMSKLANCIPSMFDIPVPLPLLLGISSIKSSIWDLATMSMNSDPYIVFGTIASTIDKIQLCIPFINKLIKKYKGSFGVTEDGTTICDAMELTSRIFAFCICEAQFSTVLQCLAFCEAWFPGEVYSKCQECYDIIRRAVALIKKINETDITLVPLEAGGERPEYLQVASSFIEDRMKRIQENGVAILTKKLLDVYKEQIGVHLSSNDMSREEMNVYTWMPKFACTDVSSLSLADSDEFIREYNFLVNLLTQLQLAVNDSFSERVVQEDALNADGSSEEGGLGSENEDDLHSICGRHFDE